MFGEKDGGQKSSRLAALSAFSLVPQSTLMAQSKLVTDAVLASPEVAPHNAWVLLATALVFCMAAPGLSLYYGGLVRKKTC